MEIVTTIAHRVTEGPTFGYAVLILALILAPRLAEVLRLPAMVGLVLAGMALGPHGAHALASKRIALSALGEFGLLYLMFSAGLELDLKLFAKMKKAAITFALLSFAIPFSLGVFGARLLAYGWAAAVLMGSNWGSHTLVTYPLLRQMRLSRNRAVATVVGATAVTDTSALLVLSVVSGVVRPSGSLAGQLGGIAVGLSVLAVWSLLGLPRVARWFFGRVGTDRAYRFVFGIAAFLVGGVMAEAAGIDAIVGAFFAGLGLNRAVPEDSPLMDRLQFTGSTFFIPIFLVSVGVLLEPKVMVDPKTLLVALVFTIAVLGGKALAAVVAGRSFHFTWGEIGVMSGLSGSQAAATLATTLVGAKLGLFDTTTINAVLVVILASLVVTPLIVTFFGKRVDSAAEADATLGKRVLVPVWGPSTRAVIRLAGRLAATDGGIVLAASFARDEAEASELTAQRGLTTQAEQWLAKDGLESRTLFRVAKTIARRAAGGAAGRGRHAAGRRVAGARSAAARQRGVRGPGAHAGPGPAGVRRRGQLRSDSGRRAARPAGAARSESRSAGQTARGSDCEQAAGRSGRRVPGFGQPVVRDDRGRRSVRGRRSDRMVAGQPSEDRPGLLRRNRGGTRGAGADSGARGWPIHGGRRGEPHDAARARGACRRSGLRR